MQILIRAPKKLKELLKKTADEMGITLNALILQIIWKWIKENELEYEVRGMNRVKTENHLPEKPKEQLNQKVMELDSQSADFGNG